MNIEKFIEFLVEVRKEKIELVYLPAYSPDLNPDERLNADLKKVTDVHLTMLANSPKRIMKYFDDPAIHYASANF
ncbi:MAG: transposase [Chloroflexi bacterium]|nr:transposase [Chloroflexota bacterium]